MQQRLGVCGCVAFTLLVVLAGDARAQWYVGGYLGASHTRPATVSIDRPADDTSVEFEDVSFDAESFKSPQYYGYRVGYLFGERRRWGVEFEFVHPKVYSRTDEPVRTRGRIRGAAIDATAPMRPFVARYAMSHGMNLLLVNLVFRTPLAPDGGTGRVALVARAGAGPTVPHGETTIAGESLEQYEISRVAVQGAAGAEIAIRGRLSAIVDYKIARARPEIAIAGGTGRTITVIHQIAIGLAFRLER